MWACGCRGRCPAVSGPICGTLRGLWFADLFASPHFAAYLTLAVLAVMFLLFVLETYPVEVTAMVGAAVLVVVGVVPSDGVLKVFSNQLLIATLG